MFLVEQNDQPTRCCTACESGTGVTIKRNENVAAALACLRFGKLSRGTLNPFTYLENQPILNPSGSSYKNMGAILEELTPLEPPNPSLYLIQVILSSKTGFQL